MGTDADDVAGYTRPRALHRGRNAVLYAATSQRHGREVALAVLGDRVPDGDARARFVRDCDALAGLAGAPHVVPLLDRGFTADGRPYVVTPLLTGGSLGRRLARGGPLPLRRAVAVGVALAHALEAAHGHGVVHRDVTPRRVLLDSGGVPWLTGFDLPSRSAGRRGTPGFASPEAIADLAAAGPPADVHAVGATLAALLTGADPLRRQPGETELSLLLRAMSEPIPRLPAAVPQGLADLVARCVSKPAGRRPSAGELLLALRGLALPDEPPLEDLADPRPRALTHPGPAGLPPAAATDDPPGPAGRRRAAPAGPAAPAHPSSVPPGLAAPAPATRRGRHAGPAATGPADPPADPDPDPTPTEPDPHTHRGRPTPRRARPHTHRGRPHTRRASARPARRLPAGRAHPHRASRASRHRLRDRAGRRRRLAPRPGGGESRDAAGRPYRAAPGRRDRRPGRARPGPAGRTLPLGGRGGRGGRRGRRRDGRGAAAAGAGRGGAGVRPRHHDRRHHRLPVRRADGHPHGHPDPGRGPRAGRRPVRAAGPPPGTAAAGLPGCGAAPRRSTARPVRAADPSRSAG